MPELHIKTLNSACVASRRGRRSGGRWCLRAACRMCGSRRRSDSRPGCRRPRRSLSCARSSSCHRARTRASPCSPWCSSGSAAYRRARCCCCCLTGLRWCTSSCTAPGPSAPLCSGSRGPRSAGASRVGQGSIHNIVAALFFIFQDFFFLFFIVCFFGRESDREKEKEKE